MKYILVLFLLLILPITLAEETYNETGNQDSLFITGQGFFNEQVTNTSLSSRSISTQRATPLVSDLDGDGTNEIIILDGATFKLFNGKTLTAASGTNSITLNFSTDEISNIITFDIDGDGLIEILVANEPSSFTLANMDILEYNGTTFVRDYSLGLQNLVQRTDGEIILSCRDVQDCALIFNDKRNRIALDRTASSAGSTFVSFFNTTFISTGDLIDTIGSGSTAYCMPKVKTATLADCDNDGTIEYGYTTGLIDSTAQRFTEVNGWCIDMSGTTASLSHENSITDMTESAITGDDCANNFGRLFTPLFVNDIDGSTGKESVIGYQRTSDTVKMHSFSTTGAFLDDYPELFTADGILVSNIMLMDAFTDTGEVDFCVTGFDSTNQEIDLLCGSEQTSGTESVEYKFSTDGQPNITQTFNTYNVISHQGEHKNNDFTEVINTYGVFEPEDVTFNGSIFVKTLTRIFENPQKDSVVIPVDPEKQGRNDMLILTSTNLFYLDDGFSNSKPSITTYTINPCVDSTWQLNTTVNVQVTCTDPDSDQVNTLVTLYEGLGSEQVSNSSFSASGTTFSHSFTANETIGTANLALTCVDSESGVVDEIDVSFSVSNNGVEFGDCTTTVDVSQQAAEAEALINSSLSAVKKDNVGVGIISFIDQITGLGSFLGWIFVMFLAGVVLLLSPELLGFNMKGNYGLHLGAIAFFEFLLLIIGVGIGAIGIGGLITILIVVIASIAIAISRVFQGSPG